LSSSSENPTVKNAEAKKPRFEKMAKPLPFRLDTVFIQAI
jgi:hypothetical protein